jgi:hypothetical protein
MGNPSSNALPVCKIASIQKMVDSVAFLRRTAQSPMPFWVDTLCVPVRPGLETYRKQCIVNMRNIYEQASTVLVLDSSLLSTPLSSPTEKCIRLYQSGWQQRLWTFQESFLARDVHFQFSDGAQDNRSLANEAHVYENILASEGQYHHFLTSSLSPTTAGMNILRSAVLHILGGTSPADSRWTFLSPLASGIWQRRTMRKSDEILCVATMMGLDPSPFLNISGDDPPNPSVNTTVRPKADLTEAERAVRDQTLADRRMELFVTQIETFKADIIFRQVPRLRRDGYRWAQRSFLGHSFESTPGESSNGQVCQVGNSVGLKVKYPGVVLEAAPDALGCAFIVDCGKQRFEVELLPDEDGKYPKWDKSLHYCIITREIPGKIGKEGVEVMLGSRKEQSRGELRFESCGKARLADLQAKSDITGCYVPKDSEWIVR